MKERKELTLVIHICRESKEKCVANETVLAALTMQANRTHVACLKALDTFGNFFLCVKDQYSHLVYLNINA